MRPWTPLAIIALALPALAQIETQPLEPLMIPNTSANNWGTGDPDNPSQPLIVISPSPNANTRDDPFREGFNDDAFRQSGRTPNGGDTFIDRTFEQAPARGEGGFLFEPKSDGVAVTTLPALEESEPQFDDDEPRFQEAPFVTRGLFGPDRPRPLPKVQTVPAESVALRSLDKMTGVTTEMTVKTGAEAEVGRLRVAVDGCRQAARGGNHGTTAFLRIWDPNQDSPEPVFSGWMFAESPALSALDHPRYDVWVVGCEPTRKADTDEAPENPDES